MIRIHNLGNQQAEKIAIVLTCIELKAVRRIGGGGGEKTKG